MPELPEQMYCSQQICIPPSFPYLLRQYAKAAIRTQPPDLLRWSTAYFRCLALNLPPPVKPRLEYPIPKSHFGLTPGWLKALLHQLQNSLTVNFKVLWDRWIGACLQHENLIEVLVLGRFTNPWEIPWLRFVALCASHLTEGLTQTMILVCEVLTEEPEGGSAMIPLEVFTDLYNFLAAMDASEAQYIPNPIFTDSLLSLYREPEVVKEKEVVVEEEEVAEEEIVEAEEEGPEVLIEVRDDTLGMVISCPDIAADDYKREEDFPLQEPSEEKEKEESEKEESEKEVEVETAEPEAEKPTPPPEEEKPGKGKKKKDKEKVDEDLSVETMVGYMPPRERDMDAALLEDLAKAKAHLEEIPGEDVGYDYELEKLRLLQEGPAGEAEEIVEAESTEVGSEEEKEEESEKEEGKPIQMVWIEAIPGIGPTVPPHLVEAVINYMSECSETQHGMVMPRNIRHYRCPPLEVLKT